MRMEYIQLLITTSESTDVFPLRTVGIGTGTGTIANSSRFPKNAVQKSKHLMKTSNKKRVGHLPAGFRTIAALVGLVCRPDGSVAARLPSAVRRGGKSCPNGRRNCTRRTYHLLATMSVYVASFAFQISTKFLKASRFHFQTR